MRNRRSNHTVSSEEPLEGSRLLGRRTLLKNAAMLAGGAAAYSALPASSQAQVANQQPRLLIKGGYVVSMDPKVGDLDVGDVLIERGAISAVGRNLSAANAQV